jgi:uncharacterized protein
MESYAWADHRVFDGHRRALVFGAEDASLFAVEPDVRSVLARWGERETIRFSDVSAPDLPLLEALRDAQLLVPAERPSPPRVLETVDPARIPLGTLVLEVAQACNLRCGYCYAGGGSYGREPRLLSPELAARAGRYLVEASGTRPEVNLVLFGGEPLLNLPAVRAAAEEARSTADAAGKKLSISLTTNGTLFSPEALDLIRTHRIGVSVSLDGPADVHDENRRFAGGAGSYGAVFEGLRLLRDAGCPPPAARVTLTPGQWSRIPEVFDHLRDLGLREIGIAPASPVRPELLPTAAEEEALFEAFAELGRRFEEEAEGGSLLPFSNLLDLLARLHLGQAKGVPCGAGLGYLALDAEGRFFLCHRLAGEDAYCLGDLGAGFDAARTRAALEGLEAPRREACAGCWARSLCAGGCHYENHLREHLLGQAPGGSCGFIRRWLEFGIELYARLSDGPGRAFLPALARRASC